MPKELDVPHWARSMVANYRTSLELPARVTDRMIYARTQECFGMNQEDIQDGVHDLIEETEAA